MLFKRFCYNLSGSKADGCNGVSEWGRERRGAGSYKLPPTVNGKAAVWSTLDCSTGTGNWLRDGGQIETLAVIWGFY